MSKWNNTTKKQIYLQLIQTLLTNRIELNFLKSTLTALMEAINTQNIHNLISTQMVANLKENVAQDIQFTNSGNEFTPTVRNCHRYVQCSKQKYW